MTVQLTSTVAAPVAVQRAPHLSLGRWAWSGGILIVLAFLVIYPVTMLLLGALTNTNPVVDGFASSTSRSPTSSPSSAIRTSTCARQLADRLRRRHGARGRHRADVLLGGGAHRHAVQALHRGGEHDPAVRAAAGRRCRVVDPRLAEDRPAQHHLLPGVGIDWRFNVYSMSGLIVIFGIYYAPYVYMFTASALRNMDPALEEAAEVSGASAAAHAVHRHVPADRAGDHLRHAAVVHRDARHLRHPGGARHARRHPGADHLHLQAHQLVAAALHHRRLGRDHPDGRHRLPGLAAAEGHVGRSYITVAGKAFRPGAIKLGPWRYFTLGLAVIYLFVVVVLPTLALIVAAFRKFLFIRNVESLFDSRQYSLDPFRAAVRQSARDALDRGTRWRSA